MSVQITVLGNTEKSERGTKNKILVRTVCCFLFNLLVLSSPLFSKSTEVDHGINLFLISFIFLYRVHTHIYVHIYTCISIENTSIIYV